MPIPPALPESLRKPLAPILVNERIIILDVLRGFALLGILISNMLHFSQPLDVLGFRNGWWLEPYDQIADEITVFLIEGKFYPLFSFLFGLGFSIQTERAAARGLDFKTTYRRRLWVLMSIGLLHGIFLWDGDVLICYAIFGFALQLFVRRKNKTLCIWAACLVVLPSLLFIAGGALLLFCYSYPTLEKVVTEAVAANPSQHCKLIAAFQSGSYLDAVSYRMRNLPYTFIFMLLLSPSILGLFLFGMLAGRLKLIQEAEVNIHLWRKIFLVAGSLGLAFNYWGAGMIMQASENQNYGILLIGSGLLSIFGPILTASYIAGIVRLTWRWKSHFLLKPLAAVGRMALTQYLVQSLIATTIFYGYGLGLGGTLGRLETIGIACLCFIAQIFLSMAWLNYFQQGPMEWLWRRLTYRK